MLRLSLLDVLILAIVLYSVVMSWYKGFVREVLGLITVAASVLLASWFYRRVGAMFKDVVRTENFALFLGFSVVFLATLLVGFLVILLAARFTKAAKLQWADRMLGAAFGLIRGWMIAAAILLALTTFGVQTERVKNSELAPFFLPGSRVIALVTPYEMKAKFLVGYRALERWRQQQ